MEACGVWSCAHEIALNLHISNIGLSIELNIAKYINYKKTIYM